jgi:hypothetical protein
VAERFGGHMYRASKTIKIALLAAALGLIGSGCAARDAQIAVQSSLTAMAEGVQSADAAAAPLAREAAQELIAELQPRVDSGEITREEALEAYDRGMQNWGRLVMSLEGAKIVLRLGQSAVDVWIATGNLPDSWGIFCDAIEHSITAVLEGLLLCEVDVPASVFVLSRYASEVCVMTQDFYDFDEEGE